MSKFDELKKRAEIAKEEFLFMGLRPEEVLELLAIQAQLVAALQVMLPKVRGLDDEGPSGEGWQSDELEQAIRDAGAALAAAGAQS